ncbi:MAG TPA: hypothetical protein VMT87_06520 [Vicinamibacteria bacterium]|nr:hypothetical protein [Vicinamibacteria bacterium]
MARWLITPRGAGGPLARKLSGILYAMWRDGSPYDLTMLKGAVRAKAEQVA